MLLLLGGRTAQRFSSHQRSPFDKSYYIKLGDLLQENKR